MASIQLVDGTCLRSEVQIAPRSVIQAGREAHFVHEGKCIHLTEKVNQFGGYWKEYLRVSRCRRHPQERE